MRSTQFPVLTVRTDRICKKCGLPTASHIFLCEKQPLLSFAQRNVLLGGGDALVSGADDLLCGGVLLHAVCAPARHASDGKQFLRQEAQLRLRNMPKFVR